MSTFAVLAALTCGPAGHAESNECRDVRSGQIFSVPVTGFTSGGTLISPDSLPARLCVGALQATNAATTSDGSGGAFIVWVEPSGESCNLMFQHVLASGAVAEGCAEGGRPVCEARGSQSQPAIALAGGTGLWAAWKDFRDPGASAVFVARVDATGLPFPGVPEGGVLASITGEASTDPCLVGDSQGGAWLLWRAVRASATVLVLKHFGADGALTPGWPAEGRAITPASSRAAHPIASPDGSGGLVFAWTEESPAGSSLRINHLGPSGEPSGGWTSAGKELTSTASLLRPTAVDIGGNQAYLTWMENQEDSCIAWVGSVALDGAWVGGWGGAGGRRLGALGSSASPAIAIDGSDGLYVAYLGQSDSSAFLGLRLAHFQSNGDTAQGWPSVGIEITAAQRGVSRPRVLRTDGGVLASWNALGQTADGFVVSAALAGLGALPELANAEAWPDLVRLTWRAPDSAPYTLIVERDSPDGTWDAVGRPVAGPDGLLTLDDAQVVAGSTRRYRQRISSPQVELVTGEFAVQVPASVPLGIRSLFVAGNRLVMAASIPSKGSARIELFDVQGRRLLRDIRAFDHGGEMRLDWTIPSGVNKGIYFARVVFGGQTKTRQFIVKH